MSARRDDRTDAEKELWSKFSSKLKPDPVTGILNNNDILTFMREHENDPEFQSLFESSRQREKERDEATDLDTYDFATLARDTIEPGGFWRVRVEYSGLVDPETDLIVEQHELKDYPNAKHTYRMLCDVPGGRDPTLSGEVDSRLVADFEGLPKSNDVLLFIKKSMALPISCFAPGVPAELRITHEFEPHRAALAPFLDSIAAATSSRRKFTWMIEDAKTAEFIGELTYAKASFFYEQNKSMGLRAKEQGNVAFRSGKTKEAIDHYTQALRRFEDAHCQKVLEKEKKEVMKLMAVTISNRSAAFVLPGETQDLESAVNDGTKAIFADKFYAKGYARLAKAQQASGNFAKAQDAIAEGLRLPELQNESGLVDILIGLQTDGKGLPEDDEEFRRVARRILHDDQESSKRVEDIKGLWRERITRVPLSASGDL
ncbi:hypothetical protein DFP72DRAFT_613572 [Ephemerocybe angulata]|uniref:Uncharacterized protein n=1 Tax=Ephemerocybe angulata TaxID=980116 RepID=A0A8H6LX31_9AGAR|nr:hypothetical protein DFP72DRAFT_613572 [Tulosesus angulatus]